MKLYSDAEKRKEIIRDYLKKHQRATSSELKRNLHTKVEKVYLGGMNEAYDDAHVPKPRTLKFKTKEERRKIVIDYIRKNPHVGGQTIRKNTKINFLTIFKDTKEAFEVAGVSYVQKRNFLSRGKDAERRKILISTIKANPFIGIEELMRITNISIYHHFPDIKEIYKEAGIEYGGKSIRRNMEKQREVINYIRNNSLATQREINKDCKTHVQSLFEKGIFEAYQLAKIPFPFERLNAHGVIIKTIRDDAIRFEERIALALSGYGSVNRLVKTKRGYADIILERKGKKVAIELKNYKVHEISLSQVKQLNKYLEDINSNLGFLVCLKKPKRDTFLMGENRIFLLEESELNRIPEIMDL